MYQNCTNNNLYRGFLRKRKSGPTHETHTGISLQFLRYSNKVLGELLFKIDPYMMTQEEHIPRTTLWCW